MTGPLPARNARGKSLLRALEQIGVAASCDAPDLWAASRDAWPRALLWTKAGLSPHPPDVVAWPQDTAQVSAVIRLAIEKQTCVVPIGGGSGVSGGAIPVRGGIALDLKRLKSPLRIDLPARTVEVGAGMLGARLEESLQQAGATLGHLPSSIRSATVGGWLATRSAGLLSSRYGKIEDLVIAVEAVDGEGTILHTLDGPSGGPDLTQLLVGSEGTLAVFTSARLRIWPRAARRWVRGVRFSNLEAGLRALRSVMRSGLRPSFAQLADPLETLLAGKSAPQVPQPLRWVAEGAQTEALRLALRAPALLNRLVDALPRSTLLVFGFEGDLEDDLAEEGDAALALCEAEQGEDLGPVPADRFLESRDQPRFQQAKLFAAGAFVDTLEVATTWDRVAALHLAVRHAVQGLALVRAHFTHLYLEGCAVEFTFIGLAGAPAQNVAGGSRDDAELDLEEGEARYDACWKAALGAVADAGATLSHHQGTGLARQILLPREHGEGMRQLRALKQAFDPHGVLNPGKLLL